MRSEGCTGSRNPSGLNVSEKSPQCSSEVAPVLRPHISNTKMALSQAAPNGVETADEGNAAQLRSKLSRAKCLMLCEGIHCTNSVTQGQ
jgi:hypothetical protein